MREYAVKFKWEKKVRGNAFSMDEYFVPYSSSYLLTKYSDTLFLNDLLLSDRYEGHIDGFLESTLKYRSVIMNDIIVQLDDDNIWVNNPEYDEFSLYDYLSELKLVVDMYDHYTNEESLNLDNEKKINELEDGSEYVGFCQILFDRVRFDLSVIANLKLLSDEDAVNIYTKGYLEELKILYPFLIKSIPELMLNMNVRYNVFSNIILFVKSSMIENPTKRQFDQLKDLMNNTRILGKYKQKKDGCFALMSEKGGRKYFALSGVQEYNKFQNMAKKQNFENLAVEIIKTLSPTANISQTNVRDHIFEFNWAYLNENTKRYVQLEDGSLCLKRPIKYIVEKNREQKADQYSCCERKILSFSDRSDNVFRSNDKEFYIRWAPCPKCAPAISRTKGSVKIFAYGKYFATYKANGYKMSFGEYKIDSSNQVIKV